MSLSDRYLDSHLCVNIILFNVVYSQNNLRLRLNLLFLCSVISQGKIVTLDTV